MAVIRKDLVHPFGQRQDLFNEVVCVAADAYLEGCYEVIDLHLASLQGWASTMKKAKEAMLSFMASPQFKEFLTADMPPDAATREMALPVLTELLRQAEAKHAIERWTSLSEAIKFIKATGPEEHLKKNGFGSWRPVVHGAAII